MTTVVGTSGHAFSLRCVCKLSQEVFLGIEGLCNVFVLYHPTPPSSGNSHGSIFNMHLRPKAIDFYVFIEFPQTMFICL